METWSSIAFALLRRPVYDAFFSRSSASRSLSLRATAASRFSFSSSTISSGALATNFSLPSLASTRLMSASAFATSFVGRPFRPPVDHALERQRHHFAADQYQNRAFRGRGRGGKPRHALDDVAPALCAVFRLGRRARQHQRRQRRRRGLASARTDRIAYEVDHQPIASAADR
jgi:hypothetical protein